MEIVLNCRLYLLILWYSHIVLYYESNYGSFNIFAFSLNHCLLEYTNKSTSMIGFEREEKEKEYYTLGVISQKKYKHPVSPSSDLFVSLLSLNIQCTKCV